MEILTLITLLLSLTAASNVLETGGPSNLFDWIVLLIGCGIVGAIALFVGFMVLCWVIVRLDARRRAREHAERFKDVTRLPNGSVRRPTVDGSRMVIDRHDLPRVDGLVQVQIDGTDRFYLEGGNPDEAKDGAWA